MDKLDLLKTLGVEVINSAPECQSVIRWSGIVAIIVIMVVIMVGTFLGTLVFLYKRAGYHSGCHVQPAFLMMTFAVVIAGFVPIANSQVIEKEEPTGKTLYTVVASDQTDMATLQQNFDIVENVTYRTFIVRIKDESVVKADSDTSRTWRGLVGDFS